MKALFLLVWLPVVAAAQTPADVLKQGADVFSKTCANGYCHGDQGAGGGAPRLAARGFDQTFVTNTVTRGIPNTAMQSFANSLSRSDLAAVIAYVAKLNGISAPVLPLNPAPPAPAPALSVQAARGRELFSDAVRGFYRCSTCHDVNGIGIPVSAPLVSVPQTAAALKSLSTPRVSTVTVSGDTMPALVVARKARTITFYDLTTPPPVLRTEVPDAVQIREGSNWRHAAVTGSYTDAELSSILEYLRTVF